MEGKELKIEYLNVNDIKPYERNARRHESYDVEAIKESIKTFGFDDPIGIWGKDNVIVEGHGRLRAAKELGMKEVPVIRLDHLTDEERRAYALVHNKTTENSEWDIGLLELEIADIELDMTLFGFQDEDEETEAKKANNRLAKEMEIKQFEHHDYIVFVFNNQMDWLNVVSAFGLERVNAGYGKTKKIGIGRVLDGKRLLERIGNPDSDFEPWKVGVDMHE